MGIKIHIKSGQNKWEVTVDVSNTVLQLKEEIAKVSEIPVENQRLIYSGKILKDDQVLEFYKIQDEHSIHLVKSGGASKTNTSASAAAASTSTATNSDSNAPLPSNIAAGQSGGFNPLSDLTSARYAGYGLNLPSADMFGPDGGMNSMPNQDDMLRMLENPVFQSQMNEMLSNPQMIDFMIQSNPQLQAMGPEARQMFQSPFFRQMLTNPEMIRQSMQMANMMGGNGQFGANAAASSFPAPGETDTTAAAETNTETTSTPAATGAAAAGQQNPFASLFNPAMNPFAAMMNNNAAAAAGAGATGAAGATGTPAFDPSLFASMFQPPQQQQQEQDNRPPEERYESQLRQLNDMGFFDFDRNVAALRRSGGSVQGALDALLSNDV
ncbi:hypothetical protein Kpol_1068p11 [Vanderwaltozyma polyspora DSM 70294]|uniref:Ubiquitin-like domain-containing protein n=1 Tax=Vanderwaltozyma polyspora (strain ATCC 22028 / DSM 70294 / BCRC 21397 / CBS 2163 / NBRC 10782 / NRRL Y-8283 / UCD 57-17) TaxID=436907 RepID=A7TSR6_VANPO|nr:uncharacterized protein Kpol_1068p11 [Vanderwaltozyma polyspora DSM 70294]EDO14701.1 hypothetical protein Kpol_1068p11 [Vanderwaltozyma polyspora DSM 70294]